MRLNPLNDEDVLKEQIKKAIWGNILKNPDNYQYNKIQAEIERRLKWLGRITKGFYFMLIWTTFIGTAFIAQLVLERGGGVGMGMAIISDMLKILGVGYLLFGAFIGVVYLMILRDS